MARPPGDCQLAYLVLERSDYGTVAANSPTALLRNIGAACTMRAQLSFLGAGQLRSPGPEQQPSATVVGHDAWVSVTIATTAACPPSGGGNDYNLVEQVRVGGPTGLLTGLAGFDACPGVHAVGWTASGSRGGPQEYNAGPTDSDGRFVSGPRITLLHRLARSVLLTGPLPLFGGGGPEPAGAAVLLRPDGTSTVLTAAIDRNYGSPSLPADRSYASWVVSGGMCIGGTQAADPPGTMGTPDVLPDSGQPSDGPASDVQSFDGGSYDSLAVAADGRTVAAGYGDGSPECPVRDVRVRSADGTQRVWHASNTGGLTVLALDAHGQHLAWADDRGLHIATLTGTAPVTGDLNLAAVSNDVPFPACARPWLISSATWQHTTLLAVASCLDQSPELLRLHPSNPTTDNAAGIGPTPGTRIAVAQPVLLPRGDTPLTVSAAPDGSLLVLADHPATRNNDLLASNGTGPLTLLARGLAWQTAAW